MGAWKVRGLAALCGLAIGLCGAVAAQESGSAQPGGADADEAAMTQAWRKAMTPGEPHRELAAMAGEWRVTTRIWMDPDAEPAVSEGRAVRTMALDGRVLEEEFQGEMMDMPFRGEGRTGYDNVTHSYWSTWTDTTSTGLSVFTGSKTGQGSWVWDGETIDPTSGRVPMRIEMKLDGPTREVHEFYMPAPNGAMIRGMEMIYERP